MNSLLKDFKAFRVCKSDLVAVYGNDLINAENEKPEVVYTSDVISAIMKYRSGEITQKALLDWVNTLWFAEHLYDYSDNQSDSIASVMTELETLDEDGVEYTDADYLRMIEALENNTEFIM